MDKCRARSVGGWEGGIGGRLDADQGDRPSCGTRRGGRTGGRAARGAEERTFQSALLETRGTSCLLTCRCLPALPGPARAELHLGSSRAAWQQLGNSLHQQSSHWPALPLPPTATLQEPSATIGTVPTVVANSGCYAPAQRACWCRSKIHDRVSTGHRRILPYRL